MLVFANIFDAAKFLTSGVSFIKFKVKEGFDSGMYWNCINIPLSLESSEAFLRIFNNKETLSRLLNVYRMSSF